jgi:hypothetical protein
MWNTAVASYDYTIWEEENFTPNKPCSLGNIISKNNCVVYYSNPVTIKIDNFNNELNMTQWDPSDDVYDDIYSSVEDLLSIDEKEQKTIKRMAKKWYVLVGQLNEDGTYDKFAQAYVNYIWEKNWTISGAIEWLRSRPRNQKAVIPSPEVSPGMYYAETIEEVKNWWKLLNDWTAFIFAYLPEIAKKKLESKRINILQTVISDSAKSLLSNENDIGIDIINAVNKKSKK